MMNLITFIGLIKEVSVLFTASLKRQPSREDIGVSTSV